MAYAHLIIVLKVRNIDDMALFLMIKKNYFIFSFGVSILILLFLLFLLINKLLPLSFLELIMVVIEF
jgi:hypothetical protein